MPLRRDQRVAVLVDVQNLFYAAKHVLGGRIHYERLLHVMVGGRGLVRAFAYVVRDPDVEMGSFLNALHGCGFDLRVKTSRTRPDGTTRGASGNGELVPVVERVRALGVATEVWGVEQATAVDLLDVADRFEPITGELLYVSTSPEPVSAALPDE